MEVVFDFRLKVKLTENDCDKRQTSYRSSMFKVYFDGAHALT